MFLSVSAPFIFLVLKRQGADVKGARSEAAACSVSVRSVRRGVRGSLIEFAFQLQESRFDASVIINIIRNLGKHLSFLLKGRAHDWLSGMCAEQRYMGLR
jgi:hypothetical protein